MVMRIGLLMSIAWIVRLTAPLFTVLGQEISGRDLILIGGGLFLLGKATLEIHERLEGEEEHGIDAGRAVVWRGDRPDHAARHRLLARLGHHRGRHGRGPVGHGRGGRARRSAIMMFSAEPISAFVNQHPTVKVLALSFLLLIGMSLVGDGLDMHVPEGLHLLRDGILGLRRAPGW